MRQVKEVLRLKFERKLTHREISASVGLSKGSVSGYLQRAEEAGIGWEEAEQLPGDELERRLFKRVGTNEPRSRTPVDFDWVHRELRRPGVTLQLLWVEYNEAAAERRDGSRPYQYSQFCELYRRFRKQLHPSMRQVHRAGHKAFVDYSGKKLSIVDPATGEVTHVELFVMVLGASNHTYAEATLSQKLPDFIGSHVRAFEYFGCVPEVVVPDQLRSAVSVPDWYEPGINATYAEMAKHYGTAVVPARPRKPKDKAKVEVGVQVAQRWIVARLRNRTFFSLADLNREIAILLEDLNTRPFKKLEGCRRSAFEQLDRPAMKPMPGSRYELAEWSKAKVNIDYHIDVKQRFYSVPCTLLGRYVEARTTATVIEVFHDGHRVASHRRSHGPKGTVVTCEEHRPRSHREYGDWPPERLVSWAATVGPETVQLVRTMLAARRHPEAAYRSCQGLIRLAGRYGKERCEQGCRRAVEIGSPRYKTVAALLKRGLERTGSEQGTRALPHHESIRGGEYFDRGEQSGGLDISDQDELDTNADTTTDEAGVDTDTVHPPDPGSGSDSCECTPADGNESVATESATESQGDTAPSGCPAASARQGELPLLGVQSTRGGWIN